MHRQPLLQLLNTYEPYDSDEVSLKEKIINFITHHPDCFERTCREGHITASAWIVNFTGDQFLMTLHKKRKLWLPLGGHSDGDCDIHHTSLREAQEESGVVRRILLLLIMRLHLIHMILLLEKNPSINITTSIFCSKYKIRTTPSKFQTNLSIYGGSKNYLKK